jgi:hypothetical protein
VSDLPAVAISRMPPPANHAATGDFYRAWPDSHDLARSASKPRECGVSDRQMARVLLPVPGNSPGKPAPMGLRPESEATLIIRTILMKFGYLHKSLA